MKLKIGITSILTASVIMAAVNTPSPLAISSRSSENGGSKHIIDAYSDGGGVLLINQAGASKIDNSAVNNLVFKYGNEAKLNNATLKDQIKTLSTTSTLSDKALADKIGVGTINNIFSAMANDTACSDGNSATSGDKWVDGVCIGSAEPLAFNIGTASAGNFFSNNDGYAPYRAIVGSSGSWASQYNTWGTFWQMSYASATVINEIRLKATLVDFDIQGSNNNSTWTNLLSVRGRSELGDIVIKHSFTNTTPYLYYRFSIIKGNGTTPVSYIEEADFRRN